MLGTSAEMTLAGGLPSVREMILKRPTEGLADIEIVRGLGMRCGVRGVHSIAIEKRDPNRWYPAHHTETRDDQDR